MTISYESNFFRFWRRQWQGLTHQWHRTQRQVRSSLSFGVQSLIYPFLQFLKNQPWLTPTLQEQIHHQGQHLRASTRPPHPPSVDEPLDSILASLEFEWLAPSPSPLQLSPESQGTPRLNKQSPGRFQPLAWAQRLGRGFIRRIRKTEPQPIVIQLDSSRYIAGMPQTHTSLPAFAPTSLAPLPSSTLTSPKPLSLVQRLGHWFGKLTQLRKQGQGSTELQVIEKGCIEKESSQLAIATIKGSIQGVACQLGDRQLVLVNTANQVLALLSPEQQRILHHRIFWHVARYYQRCCQWSRRWGIQGSSRQCPNPQFPGKEPQRAPVKSLPGALNLWERFSLWLSGLGLPTAQPRFALVGSISPITPGASIFEVENIENTIAPVATAVNAIHEFNRTSQRMESRDRQYAEQLIIDIDAAFMGYELHWLEKCLLWCDRWLTRLEHTLEWFIQGVIQFILGTFR
ncbi:hypothetical protein L3556_16000 [Candidatus Synechococcus calcipolaris G9]|uniref:Uncharacterized protein n=1 Tax=Candidatus Synechococcus calcipolaris G9 TaxID=1497997 RepID=A0ABT6F3U9_9SYNE|nr:hypothetical protein [Candidatus Synechococcus calcipolaris]MDG2992422.1 hypothetical protein [Candidatus Synechococcus calcipolaris G9]